MNEVPYTHIHEKFRHIAHLPDKERIDFIHSPRWVGYSTANQIIDVMQRLMNQVKQHRMPNLLIIGDSNNGKTTIINRFYDSFGENYTIDKKLVIPIVKVQAPPTANEKDLYIAIIETFKLPYRSTDSASKLRYQAVNAFRHTHVKLMIIDEVHSMLTGTARQQRTIMNVIKFLCNELLMPIVLCGTKDAIRILHTDPQHASRFDVAELPVWTNNKDFKRLVGSFEKVLPLKKPSNLIALEKVNLIYSISTGNLGNVKRLINDCAISAIESGEEEVTIENLKSKLCLKPTKGLRKIIG